MNLFMLFVFFFAFDVIFQTISLVHHPKILVSHLELWCYKLWFGRACIRACIREYLWTHIGH